MKARFTKVAILTVMLLGLPMSGIILAGKPLDWYLEFPPRTLYVLHAAFSWPLFLVYALFVLTVLSPFFVEGWTRRTKPKERVRPLSTFPWWGWTGIALGCIAWVLAWSRFPWFEKWQAHTFTPLWVAYIITISALTYRRAGRCMLLRRPLPFLLLFPASALFWWFFEYLNRFVQNWTYVGPHFDPWEYFWYATLSFSTVLPAFTGTREWVVTFSWPEKHFGHFLPVMLPYPKLLAALTLITAGVGLFCLGIWPDYLFALLWVSPLLIIVSLQALFGEPHIFSELRHGNWALVVSSAVAALICGFFWEMWNFYSLAKWNYQVPFVQRFHVFEMPILGYAGYLPFGVECAVIVEMLQWWSKGKAPVEPAFLAGL